MQFANITSDYSGPFARIELPSCAFPAHLSLSPDNIVLTIPRDQLSRAAIEIEELCLKHRGRIVIGIRAPDDQTTITIKPSGRVLPGPAAVSITKPESWNVRQHSLADICADSPAFTASRLADFAAPDLPPVNLAPAPDAPAYTYRRM